MLQLSPEKTLYHLLSSKRCKKLVSVLTTSMPVTETREEAVEADEIARASKNNEESEGESPENSA